MAAQQSEGRIVDGAAPEVQDEFDRLWMALDGLTKQANDLSLGLAKAARVVPVVAQVSQCAPVPDYRIGEPVSQVIDAQWPDVDTSHGAPAEGPCSCDEAMNLRGRVAELEAENEALDASHRHVLNQRNEAKDLLESNKIAQGKRISELESALAQATARASTAPASQADILCVEGRLKESEERIDDLNSRFNEASVSFVSAAALIGEVHTAVMGVPESVAALEKTLQELDNRTHGDGRTLNNHLERIGAIETKLSALGGGS
jgi:hypothetical protein